MAEDSTADGDDLRTPIAQGPSVTGQPPPPRRIGPYRLLQKVGEGGMGEVWLAEQEAPIRRRVALKLIKWGLDSKEVIARFESERQALALMSHRGIAKVLDAGASETGRPYFVLEYVKGSPIVEYCDAQRLDTRARLELFEQVCAAIHHAHQRGVIHRDIKPSNVLITVEEGKPRCKVIDFGVAKAIHHRLTEKTVFTQHGLMVGTPAYMSPEQADLGVLDIDTTSDVYSLGVLLYELLTGMLPFDKKRLLEAGYAEIQRILREEEPPRPSTRVSTAGEASAQLAHHRRLETGALERGLRGDLDWITLKALEKDRTRRYGSASELAADIRRHLEYQPVAASPPSQLYRAGRFVRRHRAGVTAFVIAVLAMVLGTVLALSQAARARAAERAAREEAATAEQVTDFLVDLFEVSDPSEAHGNTITARAILDRGVERIDTELTDQPAVRGRLLHTMGMVYTMLGLHSPADPLLEEALELDTVRAETSLGPDRRTADLLKDLSIHHAMKQEVERAVSFAERARAAYEAVDGPAGVGVGWSHYQTARMKYVSGRLDESETDSQRAIEIFETLPNPSTPLADFGDLSPLGLIMRCLHQIALIHAGRGDLERAMPVFEEELVIAEREWPENHPDWLILLHTLAWASLQQEKYEDAENYLRRELVIVDELFGSDNFQTYRRLWLLAQVLGSTGRHGEAADTYARAVSGYQDEGREFGVSELESFDDYARSLRAAGRTEELESVALLALEVFAEHPDWDIVLDDMAALLEQLGEQRRADGDVAGAEEVEARAARLRDQG